MERYEWDEEKNKSNQKKHNMAFEDAIDTFNDEGRIKFILIRNEERRYLNVGKAHQALISVVFTTRDLNIRIISARRSSKKERKNYLINKFKNNDDNK